MEGRLEPRATGMSLRRAGYSGQGCRCSLEEMTFPSLISSVMVRIWVLTWGVGPLGPAGAQGPVEM